MNPARYGRPHRPQPGDADDEARPEWRGGGGAEAARWRPRHRDLDELWGTRCRSPSPKRSLQCYDRSPDRDRNLWITVGNDRYHTADDGAHRLGPVHSRLGPTERRSASNRQREGFLLDCDDRRLDSPRTREDWRFPREKRPPPAWEASGPRGPRAPRACSPDSGYALHRPEEAPALPKKSILKRRAEPSAVAPQEWTASPPRLEPPACEGRSWFKGDAAPADGDATGERDAAGLRRATSLRPFRNAEDRETFLHGDDGRAERCARAPSPDEMNPPWRPPEDYAKLANILKAIGLKNDAGKADEGGPATKRFPAPSAESRSRAEPPSPEPGGPGSGRDAERKRPEVEAAGAAPRPDPLAPPPRLSPATNPPACGAYERHAQQQPGYCAAQQPAAYGQHNPLPAWPPYQPPAAREFAGRSLSPVATPAATPATPAAPSAVLSAPSEKVARPNLHAIQTLVSKPVQRLDDATEADFGKKDRWKERQQRKEKETRDRFQLRLLYLQRRWDKLQQEQDLLQRYNKGTDNRRKPLVQRLFRMQEGVGREMKKLLDEMSALSRKSTPPRDAAGPARTPLAAADRQEGQQGPAQKGPSDGVRDTFYDAGEHWCKSCNVTYGSLLQFLTHLHSKRHRQTLDPDHRPRVSGQQRRQQKEASQEKRARHPAKGSEFLVPVSGYYCQLCAEFCGDQALAEEHATSWQHNNNYQKMVLDNWVYEMRRSLERKASQTLLAESERRRHMEEMRKLSEENKVKLMKTQEEEKARLAELDEKCAEGVAPGPKVPIKITLRADGATPGGAAQEEKGGGPAGEMGHDKEAADGRPPGKTISIKLSGKTLVSPVSKWAASSASCVAPSPAKIKPSSPTLPANLRAGPCAPSFDKPASPNKFISIGSKGTGKPLPVMKEDGKKEPLAPPAAASEVPQAAQPVPTARSPVREQTTTTVLETVLTGNEAASCVVQQQQQQQQEEEELAPGTQLERDTALTIPVKPLTSAGTHQPSSAERPRSCLATANAKD